MRAFFLLVFTCSLLYGDFSVAGDRITLEQIMADPDWIGGSPERPMWSVDSSRIFFQRKQNGRQERDWWVVDIANGAPQKLSLHDALSATPAKGDYDHDRRKRIYTFAGDLFVQDMDSGNIRQLTRTEAHESLPAFLGDTAQVQFSRNGSLLIRDLTTGLESEPAIIHFDDKPDSDRKKKGFVDRKEIELFDYLQLKKRQADEARDATKKTSQTSPFGVGEPFYLGKKNRSVRQTLSPDGNWLAVVTVPNDSRKTGRADKMPIWVTADAYAESQEVRSLVGTGSEGAEVVSLLDLGNHKVIEIDLTSLTGITSDPLKSIRPQDKDESDDEAKTAEDTSDPDQLKPRGLSITSVKFSNDSKHVLFQCFSTDNKDRWVCVVACGGKKHEPKVLHHEQNTAWINRRMATVDWVGQSHQVCYVSEASGYAHLYVANEQDCQSRQITSGSYEVSSVQVSEDGLRIFFRSNQTHPGIYELSVADIKTRQIKKLTSLGGMNDFLISPDERWAVATHSELNKPPQLVVVDLHGEGSSRQLTNFTSRAFQSVNWTVPRIVQIPTREGRTVYSRLYLPEEPTDEPRPAIVFVHGAGYLQNAHQGWSYYFREFMFHSLLTQRGYVVLDMDYRASAGYGRDWRTAIYRQMGTPELEDLEDGVTWLSQEHNVDRKRVGVYGGSYGGFMTLMALFRKPRLFACGAALRPVTDWAHYNHGYTSNILNTPDEDPLAYEKSSPIYFAEGLQHPLLICHGMLDDNVFFKDTVRLVQRLIELEKQDWNVAVYPVEPHGFRQPSSWLDEYRRILKLFETHLSDSPK
ncbi:MAG: prolyl oligopeptidase family serine peptidase [Fuerstiella sp.]|nr:prolyl oligopeptidase family serine peptidase [Fuerstiella sp.]MCP4856605.1 prolyl oligopeptidase family serine peptidase [Fuerstiella sp.]